MGKRIISQRRGKGSSRWRSPSHRYIAKIKYMPLTDKEFSGVVIDILDCPGHTAPLIKVRYDDGTHGFLFAPEKIFVGDRISVGKSSEIKIGNILPLSNIPEGTSIYNIESSPGDGGKFVRSSGVFARILSKTENKVVILMPSKKSKDFDFNCRATVGIIAGGGRKEKPFVKAGNRYHAMRAKGRLYPETSAVAMNPNDHPFGCGRGRHEGKPTIPPRNAPPGRKVGQIGARRTGRRK